MGIIDYKELETPIHNIELMLEEFDQEEKALILKIITQRFMARKQKHQLQENVNNIKFGSIMKRIMKGEKEDDRES